MSLKVGKRDIEAILPALDPDWKQLPPEQKDDLYAVGQHVLEAAWERYEQRGRYYCAVQVHTIDGLPVKRTDPRGGSVLLGPYVTAGQAATAARQARVMLGGKYTCLAVVLDAQDATPTVWVKAFVEANVERDETGRDPRLGRIQDLIDAHELDRIINPPVCGSIYLDKALNVLGFCDRPHRHDGEHDEHITLPLPDDDPRRENVSGLTQTINIEETHEPDGTDT